MFACRKYWVYFPICTPLQGETASNMEERRRAVFGSAKRIVSCTLSASCSKHLSLIVIGCQPEIASSLEQETRIPEATSGGEVERYYTSAVHL